MNFVLNGFTDGFTVGLEWLAFQGLQKLALNKFSEDFNAAAKFGPFSCGQSD